MVRDPVQNSPEGHHRGEEETRRQATAAQEGRAGAPQQRGQHHGCAEEEHRGGNGEEAAKRQVTRKRASGQPALRRGAAEALFLAAVFLGGGGFALRSGRLSPAPPAPLPSSPRTCSRVSPPTPALFRNASMRLTTFAGRRLLAGREGFAFHLGLDQIGEGALVAVLELAGIELSAFGRDDVVGQVPASRRRFFGSGISSKASLEERIS